MTFDCSIQDTSIDIMQLRASLPTQLECGGYACFEGLVRNLNHGKTVTHLEYEAYEPLAVKEMHRICERAAETYGVPWIRVVHRVGRLLPGEPAVIIQALAPHRAEAFDACRAVIDRLKVQVPIWKKEHYADGSHDWTRCHEHAHDSIGMTGMG